MRLRAIDDEDGEFQAVAIILLAHVFEDQSVDATAMQTTEEMWYSCTRTRGGGLRRKQRKARRRQLSLQ